LVSFCSTYFVEITIHFNELDKKGNKTTLLMGMLYIETSKQLLQ